jgi:hypothetical protein
MTTEFKDQYTILELEAHRKDWLAALRSGKYKQGKIRLRYGDNYCCLGIACEVAGMEPIISGIVDDEPIYSYEGRTFFLMEKVMKYYGFKTSCGGFIDAGNCNQSLSLYNDDGGYNFVQIAQIAERYMEEIFTNEPVCVS